MTRWLRAKLCYWIGHGRAFAYDEEHKSALVVICPFCLTVLEGVADE